MENKIREHDYVVIGAGSGGLVVAVGLLKAGKDVVVVSKNIGGDCTHYGCVPSKTLYHLSRDFQIAHDERKAAIKKDALNKLRSVVAEFVAEEDQLIHADRLITGTAAFVDKNTLAVVTKDGEQHLRFRKKCIIATGGHPKRIELAGAPTGSVITNEEVFYLPELPKSITIFGGGPIGAELSSACARFNIPTYLVSKSYLPKEPAAISERSLQALKKLGVKYMADRADRVEGNKLILKSGDSIPATEHYLLAIGRVPNTDLQLEKAGIEYDEAGIKINQNLETSQSNILAIGDCTQSPQFTHVAANQARFVLRKILFPLANRKDHVLPRVTFTHPVVASTGELELQPHSKIFELDFAKLDRARTQGDRKSYGMINVDLRTGTVLGAAFFGNSGEELVSMFSLMIEKKIALSSVVEFMTPYPSYANILDTLTTQYMAYLVANWRRYPLGALRQFWQYLF